jgi:chromosome segregation protein
LEGWRNNIRSLEATVIDLMHTIAVDLEHTAAPPEAPEPETLKAAHADYVGVMTEAQTALEAILARVQAALDQPDAATITSWSQWHQKLTAFRDAYAVAVKSSSTHKERMGQLQDIEAKLAAHQKENGATERRTQDAQGRRGGLRRRAQGVARCAGGT